MAVESLGMIEVRGFLGAVVAADAALKAANVQLSDMPITRGGLVTVLLTGDVAAVNASVDAGVASIEDFNCLISQHVIARMDNQTAVMAQPPLPDDPDPKPEAPKPVVDQPAPLAEPQIDEPSSVTDSDTQADAPKTENASAQPEAVPEKPQVSKSTASAKPEAKQPATQTSSTPQKPITGDEKTWVTDKQELEKMRVVDLRRQAYRMNIKTLTKKQIKMGNKKTLVQAILDDLQRRDNTWI